MAGAGGIRAGRAFVEVGATDISLKKVLIASQKRVEMFGRAIGSIGSKMGTLGKGMLGLGVGASAGLGLGVKAFASYEDAMANLKANARPTADELLKIEVAIADIGKSTGVGPAKVASAMAELLKAGMPLKDVLGGAAKATLEFAKVAGIDAAQAATVLTDTMNVFGVDATTAVDTLSRAADASSVSLAEVTESFSQVSAVAKLAGLTIDETAAAIAILGNAGVKGSDAGTSLKTMLQRLQAPAEEGAKAIAQYGINVRNADHTMKDMPGILAELQAKLGGLNDAAKADAFRKIFGSDAIRAGSILLGVGAKGFTDFSAAMSSGLPVSAKFQILMNTLSGGLERAQAAIERLGVAIGTALAPAFGKAVATFTEFANIIVMITKANPDFIQNVAKLAGAAIAAGAGLVVAGAALSALGSLIVGTSAVITAVATTLGFLATPLGLATAAFLAVTAAVMTGTVRWVAFSDAARGALASLGAVLSTIKTSVIAAFNDMQNVAMSAFGGIANALKSGDLGAAAKILWAGLKVEWLIGRNFIMDTWHAIKVSGMNAFDGIIGNIGKGFIDAFAFVRHAWVSLVGGMVELFVSAVAAMIPLLAAPFKLLEPMFAMFGIDIGKTIDDATKAIDSPEDKKRRADARDAEHADIEKDRQAGRGTVDFALQARANTRGVDPDLARRQAELDKAKGDLDKLNNKALLGAALAGGAAGAVGAPDAAKPSLARAITPEAMEDVHEGFDAAARKVDVQGTFNASAVGRIGAGTSVSSQLADLIKSNEKVEKQLERVNSKLRNNVLVTAP